jgi:hypothetical protein
VPRVVHLITIFQASLSASGGKTHGFENRGARISRNNILYFCPPQQEMTFQQDFLTWLNHLTGDSSPVLQQYGVSEDNVS